MTILIRNTNIMLRLGLMLLICAMGCRTAVQMPDSQRIARYRPQVAALPLDGTSVVAGAREELPKPPQENVLRSLQRGDSVIISLRGIPTPQDIQDVIDGFGEVTLPYIGEIKMAGETTSKAERKIEKAYVDGGIYNQINVIVVAEDETYFVQGEVARQGKFQISGPVTLLQAVSEAGGFTPFANRKKIKVIRGEQVLFFNGREIADGEAQDPLIEANDIIEVLRKWI